MRRSFASMILVLVGLVASCSTHAAEVTGHFSAGPQRFEPAHATAIRIRDPAAPRSFATYVVLSQNPVDAAAAATKLDPYAAIINDPGLREGGAIRLSIGDGGAVSTNAQFDWAGTQYVSSTRMGDDLVGEFGARDAQRIAGRVRYKAPVEIDGVATGLDVSFDVPVLSAPRGTALPKGGGAAGKAFLAFAAAVEKGDFATAQQALSAGQAPQFAKEEWQTAEEHAASGLETLGAWLLKKPTVGGGESFPGHVVLEVVGEKYPGRNALALVRMVEEGGAWRYDESATIGLLRE